MLEIVDEGVFTGGICSVCCLLLIIVFIFGGGSGDNSYSSTNIVANDTLTEHESLEILNMTNVTLKNYKLNFVYYDHNTSDWSGCYGLNYTVITDTTGNSYMLDHATTDILGEDTNYTFKYPGGIGLVYDNNTETEIYNNSGLYYIHEVRDENNTVIKSLTNFTLYDKSHEPELRPIGWIFVYGDHNSSVYEGDEGLYTLRILNNSTEHKFFEIGYKPTIIGLAYESNKTFNYSYGLSGVDDYNLRYPNGTRIISFDIYSYNLKQDQKDFITNYYGRIDDVRHQQEINAIYGAQDEAYDDYVRYMEYHNSKPTDSYYVGTNGYGYIRSY